MIRGTGMSKTCYITERVRNEIEMYWLINHIYDIVRFYDAATVSDYN